MSNASVTTKSALIQHIERDWAAINQFLNTLSAAQWTQIENPDGWRIQDHVAHLSAWEQSVIAFLTGIPRHEGLGISEALYFSEDVDAMNAAIFERHKHEQPQEVRENFQQTHAKLLALLDPLSDVDLQLPYAHYLPDEPGEGQGPPAITVINNNTTDHYREHLAWMQEMLAA
ncbi:MAG: ClbS/DfsB family four-helix bundle protein [Anaerolineae bacterium]|nr:ClbS/DfsB family four-helix bundle protein [Anaerolineae bacterium]